MRTIVATYCTRLLAVAAITVCLSEQVIAAPTDPIQFTQSPVQTTVNVIDLTLNLNSTTTGYGLSNGNPQVPIINFETDEDATTPASGQARIEAASADNLFTTIILTALAGQGFSVIEFNPVRGHDIDDGETFTVEAFDQFNTSYLSDPFDLDNGENRTASYVKIESLDAFVITKVIITASSAALLSLEQIRVTPREIPDNEIPGIPEPGSMTLLALGSIGLGGFLRRKMKKEAVEV